MQDPVWEELGRIDYFLDHLARAVERGEVPAESYERLAPGYLERRGELAGVLERRQRRQAPAAAVPAPLAAEALPAGEDSGEILFPLSTVGGQDRGSRATTYRPQPARAARPAAPPREPIAVSTMLAYVGALLVVVAVAIFTVYNWQTFSPVVKLASLAGVTAVFYAAGEGVRVGLKLPVIGVALLGVGSAMLLFDGWLTITALGLSGPMPWALVLLACSLAYWATELRVAGKWFGAFGAVAQVAWWWLLGRGMGWSLEPILVALAFVALAWVVLGSRTPREGALETLGLTLRWGGPILAALTTAGVVFATVNAVSPASYIHVAQALAVLVLAAAAFELSEEIALPGLSAVAVLPAIASVADLRMELASSWPFAAAVLATLALVCAAYALWRGRTPYAVAAVLASVAALVLGTPSGGNLHAFVGALAGIGLAWLALAWVLWRHARRWADHAAPAWETCGAIVLALATLLLPVNTEGLFSAEVSAAHVAVAAGLVVAWAAASWLSRGRNLGWVAFGVSFYALAALLRWSAPDLHRAWFAAALLMLAVAWSQSDPFPELALELRQREMWPVTAALLLAIPVGGLVLLPGEQALRTWPAAALLALAASAWLGEGMRRRMTPAFPVAAVFAVLAAALAAATAFSTAWASTAAAAAALAIAGVAVLDRGDEARGALSAIAGALVASMCATLALGNSVELQVALAILVVAWSVVAYAARVPECAFAASLAGGAFAATALDAASAPPLATLVCFGVAGAVSLMPTAFLRGLDARLVRLARTLALAGAFMLVMLVGMGWSSWLLEPGGDWWAIGWPGLAAALVLLGCHVLVWSGLEGVETGTYVGIAAFVLAYWVLLSGGGVRQAELYLVAGALYSAGVGYLWASREEGREVPGLADAAAVGLGVVWPFLLSFAAWNPSEAYTHGLLALGFATVAIFAGLALRVRTYFLTGLVVAALDSLWLSREFIFALPKWLLIGTVGVVLIGVALGYAQRQEEMGEAAGRMRDALADWR